MESKTWAIIGGGNGGQALAGHLGLMGHKTRLYDIFSATIEAVNAKKAVTLKGAVTGEGPVEFATGDIKEALEGADHIMIVVPAMAHAELAELMAPHLKDGASVYLHPGAALGALEFYCLIKKFGCQADVTVSEIDILVYACRAEKPGVVNIMGIKQALRLGTIPAARNAETLGPFKDCFPQTMGVKNVLATTMAYGNAVLHPGPSLLNVSMIESKYDWRYYIDGFSPSIGAFTEKLDRERLEICRALGVDCLSIIEWLNMAYNLKATSVSEATSGNPAYQEVKEQKSMYTRYVLEDIPNGLVPYIELARLFDIPTPCMDTMVQLAYLMLDEKEFPPKRTLERMGLGGLSGEELKRFVTEGK